MSHAGSEIGDNNNENDEVGYNQMEPYQPMMKELCASNFQNIPWCIYEGPDMHEIEMNTAAAHHLPKFLGRQGESATGHLQDIHGICQTLRPYEVIVENFKLKALHYSLTDMARSWFLSLPSGSIRTWDQMQKKFLDKYYPVAKAGHVCRLLQDIRRLLDASAGGSVLNLSPVGVRNLIAEVDKNARFREEASRQEEFSRTISVAKAEPQTNLMTEDQKQMREMMQKLMMNKVARVSSCEFCDATNYKMDACPTL
ncbi:unnamed protein product [Rhodiola kirilowii]